MFAYAEVDGEVADLRDAITGKDGFGEQNQWTVESRPKRSRLVRCDRSGAGRARGRIQLQPIRSARMNPERQMLDKLGIKNRAYTRGYYDFVDIVDAPNPEAMLAFSVWYSTQRLGRTQSMPAFDAKSFERRSRMQRKAAPAWRSDRRWSPCYARRLAFCLLQRGPWRMRLSGWESALVD
jgi:uncharacterized protein with GYD domain